MVSTIRYSANASSDHHPNQVPGILIIMNPKQPNLPTCSVTSTYLLFHLLSNPSLHLIANTTLGIIMTAIKISPKTLNHSILSTITNSDFARSRRGGKPESLFPPPQHFIVRFAGGRIQPAAEMTRQKQITGTPPARPSRSRRGRCTVRQIGIYRLVPFLSKFFFNAISVGRIDPIKGIS